MHIIWDWNGTLFADLHVVVDGVNVSLEAIGSSLRIDADGYRDHYRRPVRGFYDAMLGRRITDAEWSTINQRFHDAYSRRFVEAAPASDAHAAANEVARLGLSQSILSMWTHELLVPTVDRYGLADSMLAVRGSIEAEGDRKAELLTHHLEEMALETGTRIVMVGDTFDDARAAAEVGVGAVFYDGGSHHREALEATGLPVADTLLEAVTIARGL